MPIQRARHLNLARVLRWLEENQATGWEAQARALDNPVTPYRLEAMAEGADIPVLVARHIEVELRLPRDWMDDPHAPIESLRTAVFTERPIQETSDVAHLDRELSASAGPDSGGL